MILKNHDTARFIYLLNPIACLLECFRDAMVWGAAPDPWLLSYVTLFSLALCAVGFALFCRGEGKFAKYV